MRVDLTIAVLTYKDNGLLTDCLQSLWAQDISDPSLKAWELLIVDDASPEPPQILLPHRLVRHASNSGSNILPSNTAFREAQGEWVLLMANDVRLHPGAIEALWAHRFTHDITQPVLYQPDGKVDNVGLRWVWPGYGVRVRNTRSRRVDAFANTCVLMKQTTWLAVGGFDVGLGISHEDIDFSLRARRLGYRIGYCPHASATHLMGQTIGRVVQKPLTPYYQAARHRTILTNYQGLDRWARLTATGWLDGLSARARQWRHRAPDSPQAASAPP